MPGWKANCNNPVTQVCTYLNALGYFSPPGYLQIGRVPRVMDYVSMPAVPTFNMAFLKDFPIHEQVRLAFRAELFGALNHVYFSGNQNNFTLYTGLNYVGGITPVATKTNILTTSFTTSFSSLSTGMGGNRTIQLGLKLYF